MDSTTVYGTVSEGSIPSLHANISVAQLVRTYSKGLIQIQSEAPECGTVAYEVGALV